MKYKIPSNREQIEEIKAIDAFRTVPSDDDVKSLILRFNIPTDFSDDLINEFRGVMLHLAEIGETSELLIMLANPELETTFDVFCEDILDTLRDADNQTSAFRKVNTRLESWKLLFSKLNYSILSLEKQKGLFGELCFLNSLLSGGCSEEQAILGWTGPDMDRRDFLLNNSGVEIKTSAANFPVLKISNETQLEIKNLRNLYLILYSIEVRKGNRETLNKSINDIIDRLKTPLQKELFLTKLAQYGYRKEDAEFYDKNEFVTRQVFSYQVKADFPRLTSENIPPGIFDSSYRIELSGLNKFLIDESIIISDLKDDES